VFLAIGIVGLQQATTMTDATPLGAQMSVAAPRPLGALPIRTRVVPRTAQQTAPAAGQTRVVPAGRPSVHVPILMYHYIRVVTDPRDRLGFALSVTAADFSTQMDFLAHEGFQPVDFDDLRGYLLGHGTLPAKPVVLTFDDGYRDMYTTAFPILRAHHFKAVSYVIEGYLGSRNNITREQMLEMDANDIQIASHTVSHPDLTKLSAADLHHEIFDSKTSLEAMLGHPVLDFCYPSGRVNDAVAKTVEAAGYQTATTTQPGAQHAAGDRFLWTRVRVNGGEGLGDFIAGLGQPEPDVAMTVAATGQTAVAPKNARKLPVTFPLRPPQVRAAQPPAPPVQGPIP
jgi:peptidoglycan/xylan/chitin deacetylase (PgdA/CDA1 family)